MIEQAHALKAQSSQLHTMAETLAVGEAAIVHRIADAVWENAKELELVGLLDTQHGSAA